MDAVCCRKDRSHAPTTGRSWSTSFNRGRFVTPFARAPSGRLALEIPRGSGRSRNKSKGGHSILSVPPLSERGVGTLKIECPRPYLLLLLGAAGRGGGAAGVEVVPVQDGIEPEEERPLGL